jgi:hypothetical protein
LGRRLTGLFPPAFERAAAPGFHVSEATLMQAPRAMIGKSRDDQNHWRARAEEARVHAQQMIEPVTKGMMVEVADYYESLARRAGLANSRANSAECPSFSAGKDRSIPPDLLASAS